MQIDFSNEMYVREELKTMNSDGIILQQNGKATSSLNQTETGTNEINNYRYNLNIFEINVLPGEYSNADDLRFTWEVEEFTSRQMNIKLNFDSPEKVSSYPDPDVLNVVFMSETWFFDVNRQPLKNGTMIEKEIPSQIADGA